MGGYLVARLHHHHVAYRDVVHGDGPHLPAVAPHLVLLLLLGLDRGQGVWFVVTCVGVRGWLCCEWGEGEEGMFWGRDR